MNTSSLFDLTGKTALVPGCRRGLGRSMAVALAEAGADIVGVSATLDPEGSEVQKEIHALGRRFKGYGCDFSDRAARNSFLAQVTKNHPRIDILLNNAGQIRRAPAAEHSDDYWDSTIEVNLSAQFILSREIGSHMLKAGSGKIIFTASLLSFQGGINVPAYAASKHGVAGITKALANEWANRGVNVNAIAPGYVATENTEALRADPVRARQILDRIPAGRWGTVEDFKGIAVFLASAASDYVHGAIFPVDGGWLGR